MLWLAHFKGSAGLKNRRKGRVGKERGEEQEPSRERKCNCFNPPFNKDVLTKMCKQLRQALGGSVFGCISTCQELLKDLLRVNLTRSVGTPPLS